MKHTSHTRGVRFLSSLFYFFSIFIFINAFNFQHNPPGAWRQQFMPEIQGLDIEDVVFLDSLTGYAVAQLNFILKTTNGGENWSIIYEDTTSVQFIFKKIQFISENEGFAGGFFGLNYGMLKTTDAGQNWSLVNTPTFAEDIFVLSSDTIWFVCTEGLTGGVFRTTNGGTSWVRQLSLGSFNPNSIHMLNGKIGFVSRSNSSISIQNIRKTTNSGESWFLVSNLGDDFTSMYFSDSLNGWKAGWQRIMYSVDGGIVWSMQILPSGGNIEYNPIFKISSVGSDSLWGVGGVAVFGPQSNARGILYFTSNGGNNWSFQLPDTSIRIGQYFLLDFVGRLKGWAYPGYNPTGIHTTTGGDTIFTSVRQISDILPGDFILHQNYPNPFNGATKIRFEINKKATVSIEIFDITGKKLVELVNKQFTSGEYEVDYTSNDNSSGVYFYSLSIDGIILDTKKMIVLK